jgi:DNA-binding beta-propeller fold protein YncE
MERRHSIALLALASAATAPGARAQGTFTNFETPQTHPIEVVSVGGAEHVLVCNTPDNSLEVWTATATPVKRARVSVGMGPGTVRFNPALQRAFVCNFDGDSVSIVGFSGSGAGLTASLVRTTHVGDEPADIAFHASNTIAAVTLSSRGQVALVDPTLLTPFGGPVRLDVDFGASNGMYPAGTLPMAVKAPRQIAWLPSDRLFVLNFMGAQQVPGAALFVDVDLWRMDAVLTPGSVPNYVGQLGTTNHAFALDSSGTRMFVVGTKAQNLAAVQLANVSAAPTGFVQSWLSVIDVPAAGNMTLRPEAGSGIPTPAGFPDFPSVNLNRNYTPSSPAVQEVATGLGISQPTDVDLFETGGVVTSIALTGYHSDNVALLTPLPNGSSTAGGYAIGRVAFSPSSGYSVVGPRGLAFNAAGTLLFVHGRLDNTLRVVDTSTLMLASTSSMQDPTTAEIRAGRKLLYSTKFSRGVNAPAPIKGGFVSCASCHVDGRTDGLAWDLSEPSTVPGAPIPPALIENPNAGTVFPNPKNQMVTQTLQGLINYPLNESFLFLATNAPYHWRADKNDFVDFNEAFVNLQRMPSLTGSPSGAGAQGVTPSEMLAYRRFVFTIRHPPNPEQPFDRRTSGAVPSNPNVANPTVAGGFSGARFGRALYHNNVFPCGSCVGCHSLPDGSSNTITEANAGQPMETAALRNVFAREGQVHTSTTPNALTGLPTTFLTFPGSAFVSNRGLTNDGGLAFGEAFSVHTFTGSPAFFIGMPGLGGSTTPTQQQLDDARDQTDALIRFLRELDAGVAPLSGFAFTLDNALVPLDSGLNKVAFDFLEEDARQANSGFGVLARSSVGVVRGFWFDPLSGYRDSAAPGAAAITRATLLASFAGAGTVMVLQGTPLGTERRWSNASGIAVTISNPTLPPSSIVLESMAPDTFYEGTTDLDRNVQLGGPIGTTDDRLARFHTAIGGAPCSVPLQRRHEPPRRFRVSGANIRAGARLFLFMTDGTATTSFFPTGMEMTLQPTKFVGSGGNPIWETELELDALQTYAFLNGGPFAPGVQAVFSTTLGGSAPTSPLNPAFNQYKVIVVNEDGSSSSLTPAATTLCVRDTR